MNCLNILDSSPAFPSDTVCLLLKLYEYRGKEFYYREVLSQEFKTILEHQIEKDAFFIGKIFDLKLTDNRMRLLIEKDLDPKNKEEVFIKNIKKTLIGINRSLESFEYTPIDVWGMVKDMFKDVEAITYINNIERKKKEGMLSSIQRESSEKVLNELLKKFESKITDDKIEHLLVIASFYIDFVNQENFNKQNDKIMLVFLYLLLAKNGFEVIRYVSFYEHLYNNISLFNDTLAQANLGWKNNVPIVTSFHKALIMMLIDCYKELELKVDHYKFDQGNKKTDNLENIILKGPEIFTKADLREKCPYISDSTINRTLDRMKDQGLIDNLGTGRSAKWIKKIKTEKKISQMEQSNIFDMINEFQNK